MKHFAILRHGKIKSGRHLVSAGLHNVRGTKTDNADKEATPPVVLIGSAKPHRDVMDQLKEREIKKIRKGGNVAVEILMAASPEWWDQKGWVKGKQLEDQTEELQTTLGEWVKLNTAYLKKRSGDRVASLVLHLDESTPHLQALVLPVERRARKGTDDFKWKLDAEIEMGSPGRLIQRQTEYAKAMAPLGLERGKQGAEIGSEKHVTLKEHQEKLAALRDEAANAQAKSQEMEIWSRTTVTTAATRAANLIDEAKAKAKTEGERLLAEAAASIAADRQNAAEKAQEDRRVADIAAGEAAAKILEDAKRDRQSFLAEASASIAADRHQLEIDKIELKLGRQAVESKGKQMDALLSKLEPLLVYFQGLPERVRVILEGDGQVAQAVKPGGILEQALRAEREAVPAARLNTVGPSSTDVAREFLRQQAEKAAARG